MRRLAPPLLLALLAACSVTTTGAPCQSDQNCPSDQGCGSDGACSTAALSCPGHTLDGQCIPGTSCASGQVVTCTAAGGVCSSRTAQPCADPGQSCVASGGGAACACPVANACTQLDATMCSVAADQVLRCRPVVSGSACLTWQTEASCAADGLVCSASACVCPANPGAKFFADAVSGSTAASPPRATGVASPANCRYSTLTEALAAASARGSGSTVEAAGWNSSLQGGLMVFNEPGGLQVPSNVAVTTDDATPVIGHYAVTSSTALTSPLITIGPGGSITGFEIQKGTSTGDGIRTACPVAADLAPIAISTVKVSAASSGTPVPRLSTGVHVTGHCPVTMSAVAVDGAATGILVESAAETIESSAVSSTVSGATTVDSPTVGASLVVGKLTFTGGAVTLNATGVQVGASGTGTPTFSATGTTFSGNTGDAVHVARGTLVSDGCPYSSNGTHVHAEPALVGVAVSVSVKNSAGAAKMTGATNSAIRLLALGSGSMLFLKDNEIAGNGATDTYPLGTSLRRGGGIVWLAPFPATGNVTFQGNTIKSNDWDQFLVAASSGTLNLASDSSCGTLSNTFACYSGSYPAGQPQGVGLYSNGATIAVDWIHWMNQPAQMGVDVVGTGVLGFANACPQVTVCP